MRKAFLTSALVLLFSGVLGAQSTPAGSAAPGTAPSGRQNRANQPTYEFLQGEHTLRNFKFNSGETMDVRMHYRTLGTLKKDANGRAANAILIMHGTTGSSTQFAANYFAGELYGPGQPFDITRYYLIFPDDIGHGQSSRPSEGMKAAFPRYGYEDMVRAEYLLVSEGLGVNHLRLVFGTSMGGMHTWLWGERYPDFMDALMPMGSLPEQISGRNRAWRKLISDAIRNDPQWNGGNYTQQPQSLRTVAQMMYLMAENPIRRYEQNPTGAQADQALDAYVANFIRNQDANNVLYAFESSRDYIPETDLEKIKAPLLAINTVDDLINPGELGILEKQIKRVPRGRAINLPLSPQTRGHGSHTYATLWKQYLVEFMKETER